MNAQLSLYLVNKLVLKNGNLCLLCHNIAVIKIVCSHFDNLSMLIWYVSIHLQCYLKIGKHLIQNKHTWIKWSFYCLMFPTFPLITINCLFISKAYLLTVSNGSREVVQAVHSTIGKTKLWERDQFMGNAP